MVWRVRGRCLLQRNVGYIVVCCSYREEFSLGCWNLFELRCHYRFNHLSQLLHWRHAAILQSKNRNKTQMLIQDGNPGIIIPTHSLYSWLVVSTPLKNMSQSVVHLIPNWMESHKSHVPNQQPVIHIMINSFLFRLGCSSSPHIPYIL